jgi:hypothetical protein
MGMNFRPSIGQLTAFIEAKKSRSHLPQIEFPGFVPAVCLRKLKGRRRNFNLDKLQNLVFRVIWRAGKDCRIEFNLALMVLGLLNAPNTERAVNTVNAADVRAGLNCGRGLNVPRNWSAHRQDYIPLVAPPGSLTGAEPLHT